MTTSISTSDIVLSLQKKGELQQKYLSVRGRNPHVLHQIATLLRWVSRLIIRSQRQHLNQIYTNEKLIGRIIRRYESSPLQVVYLEN